MRMFYGHRHAYIAMAPWQRRIHDRVWPVYWRWSDHQLARLLWRAYRKTWPK